MEDEEALPDPLHPARDVAQAALARPADDAPATPKGDLTVVAIIAIVSGSLVVAWYLGVLAVAQTADIPFLSPMQFASWGLAVVAAVCGILCLNARTHRGLAATGFIIGMAAILLTLFIGTIAGVTIII